MAEPPENGVWMIVFLTEKSTLTNMLCYVCMIEQGK